MRLQSQFTAVSLRASTQQCCDLRHSPVRLEFFLSLESGGALGLWCRQMRPQAPNLKARLTRPTPWSLLPLPEAVARRTRMSSLPRKEGCRAESAKLKVIFCKLNSLDPRARGYSVVLVVLPWGAIKTMLVVLASLYSEIFNFLNKSFETFSDFTLLSPTVTSFFFFRFLLFFKAVLPLELESDITVFRMPGFRLDIQTRDVITCRLRGVRHCTEFLLTCSMIIFIKFNDQIFLFYSTK